MPNFEKLSERDRAVLKSIFDPNLTIGEIPGDEDEIFLDASEEMSTSDSEGCRRAKELETRAVRLAETGVSADREEALRLLDEAVALEPRAAGYNNRAQLLRLMGRDDDAMRDLDEALRLSIGLRTRARAQALCQRGVLHRKLGKEDEARRDLSEAARMGSAFAKKQVAELNPYAALCNQMLQQVMKGETNPKI